MCEEVCIFRYYYKCIADEKILGKKYVNGYITNFRKSPYSPSGRHRLAEGEAEGEFIALKLMLLFRAMSFS